MLRKNVAIEFPDSYEGCITSFCDPKLFQKKFAFNVLDDDRVWATFGCHPHHSHLYNAEVEAQLELLAKHPKVTSLLLVIPGNDSLYCRRWHGEQLVSIIQISLVEQIMNYKKLYSVDSVNWPLNINYQS